MFVLKNIYENGIHMSWKTLTVTTQSTNINLPSRLCLSAFII